MPTTPTENHRLTQAVRFVAKTASVIAAAVVLASCGGNVSKVAASQGCVIIDLSHAAKREIPTLYRPGFEGFLMRISEQGSGNVCLSFTGGNVEGGTGQTIHVGCDNPAAVLKCQVQRQAAVTDAGAMLVQASNQKRLPGASQILEGISRVAIGMKPGDEILVLSDGIQNSSLLGDFTKPGVRLDDASIEKKLDRLDRQRMLPTLTGIKLLIPYLLTSSRPYNMPTARQLGIRAFWERYAARTGAQVVLSGGTEAI